MSHLDDVIENAQHFRDAPKNCLVEVAPGEYVVTATVEQADLLRSHLSTTVEAESCGHNLTEVSLGDGLSVHTTEPDVLTRVLDSLRSQLRETETTLADLEQLTNEQPAAPVRRGPGRPRKVVAD